MLEVRCPSCEMALVVDQNTAWWPRGDLLVHISCQYCGAEEVVHARLEAWEGRN
jgi:ribosomal protein S27E